MKKNIIGLMTLLVLFSKLAFAEEILLKNGDRLSGEILQENAQIIELQTEAMGIIRIQRSFVQPEVMSENVNRVKGKDYKNAWSGEIEVGFDRRRGNASDTNLDTGFTLRKNSGYDEWSVGAKAHYAEDDRTMNAQEYEGRARYAFSFGSDLQWYNFYNIEGEHDRFSDIDYRYTPSTGLGYWFKDDKSFKLMAEVGFGNTQTKYISEEEAVSSFEIIPRSYFEIELFEGISFRNDLTLYPSITESGEYRYTSKSSLNYKVNERIDTRFSVINEYNSNPSSGTKEGDIAVISSLVYKI